MKMQFIRSVVTEFLIFIFIISFLCIYLCLDFYNNLNFTLKYQTYCNFNSHSESILQVPNFLIFHSSIVFLLQSTISLIRSILVCPVHE